MKNILVDEARGRMLALARPLGVDTVALGEAAGRTLAEDITATRNQPPFRASAMDGWAVRAEDATAGARLAIAGESAAGRGYAFDLEPGQAVRIFTGAPVPAGSDAVVIQENATRDGESVVIGEAATPGANLRPEGGDFFAGEDLLQAGYRLDAWRISLAAAAGCASLSVARRPRVAILSTGDEIVLPGATPGPHQIFNSGAPALAVLVEHWGGEPVLLTPAGDNIEVLASAVRNQSCDVVVTIGGASVGDHDLVKPALSTLGLTLAFESLKMRPGKPTSFGTLLDGRYVLGLPGNPASALVCAELFLRPLIAALQGSDPSLPIMTARTAAALPSNGPREHWMRARLSNANGVLTVAPFGDQDSSLITVFAGANALLRRPCDAPAAAVGDVVEVLRLERL